MITYCHGMSMVLKMNERTLNEFASYYKRLIRVERYLKDLIYEKYTNTYKNKTYTILYSVYFEKLRYFTNKKDKTFKDIYRQNNKTDDEKLTTSIDKMYISEVLGFFSHRIFLKDITRKNFFDVQVNTSKNEFRKIAKAFKDFRNCVCHYDTKQFFIEKAVFVKALTFFEKLVNCKYRFTTCSVETIGNKPTITSILKYIYQTHPEYFDDDRVLVNVFDDIARLIDFRTDDLPQYKSIIRQKFKTEGKS